MEQNVYILFFFKSVFYYVLSHIFTKLQQLFFYLLLIAVLTTGQ